MFKKLKAKLIRWLGGYTENEIRFVRAYLGTYINYVEENYPMVDKEANSKDLWPLANDIIKRVDKID